MSMNSNLPATAAIAITNDVDFLVCRAIYVGVGGHITAEVNGVEVDFLNAQSGSIIPVRANKVVAATTTATDLVALY